jgi:hypothetical protein
VKVKVREGKTLEEIIASDPTRGYKATGSVTKDAFVKIVYDSLKKPK